VEAWSDGSSGWAKPADVSLPTDEDFSRTFDGWLLNTKKKILGFLAEIEESRLSGEIFDPYGD